MTVSGDGTSSYLWAFDPWQKVAGNKDEQAPKQTPADFIYKMTPLAKLVFVLRNPTDRSAHSFHSSSTIFNPLTPTVAIMGTAIKHPVPVRVKPSFVIFLNSDAQPRASECPDN